MNRESRARDALVHLNDLVLDERVDPGDALDISPTRVVESPLEWRARLEGFGKEV